jgi:8-oxo-dGTP pyrophosphatase MutT (NUDIX family)
MTPIPAATVILVRPGPVRPGLEVFLLKRHRKASFMSSAFVFPGGKVDPDDGSAEVAAVRELFEEAGVLLTTGPALGAEAQTAWRRRLLAHEVTFAELLAEAQLVPDGARLHRWSRWVTPSFEPKRFDAEFFVAELPPGQVPSFDDQETVEELWVTPTDALARQDGGELRLPPPQLRTFHELAGLTSVAAVVAAAAERQRSPAALCPRLLRGAAELTLLLPWDAEYERAEGEGTPIPADHPWAGPPSRLVWQGATWRAM